MTEDRKKVAALKPPTAKQNRLLDARESQIDDPTGQADISYMHSVLTQVSLPRTKLVERRFERRSGTASVLLQAGELFNGKVWEPQPLPYGPMPRLVIAWLTTRAIRDNTQEIPIGNSATEFLGMLGYTIGGGKRGTYTTFKAQTRALAAMRLTLGRGHSTFEGSMVGQFDAWVSESDTPTLWPGRIVLTQNFFDSLKGNTVPLNNSALLALRGSSLALDIYAWMAHRLRRVHSSRGEEVSWASLKQQFGQEYAETAVGRSNFKAAFEIGLRDAMKVYPKARIEPCGRAGQNYGKRLLESPPPVAEK